MTKKTKDASPQANGLEGQTVRIDALPGRRAGAARPNGEPEHYVALYILSRENDRPGFAYVTLELDEAKRLWNALGWNLTHAKWLEGAIT